MRCCDRTAALYKRHAIVYVSHIGARALVQTGMGQLAVCVCLCACNRSCHGRSALQKHGIVPMAALDRTKATDQARERALLEAASPLEAKPTIPKFEALQSRRERAADGEPISMHDALSAGSGSKLAEMFKQVRPQAQLAALGPHCV